MKPFWNGRNKLRRGGGKAPTTQGRRVRAGRDPLCARRKAWRPFARAGDCDWPSEARPAGFELPPAVAKHAGEEVRKQAERDLRKVPPVRKRKLATTLSRAITRALKQEGRAAASDESFAGQAHTAAGTRGAAARCRAAV